MEFNQEIGFLNPLGVQPNSQRIRAGFLLLLLGIVMPAFGADDASNLLSDIERLGKLGMKAPPTLMESVSTRIEKHPAEGSAFLAKKLTPDAPEETLMLYLGLLGLCKDTNAVPSLIGFVRQAQSPRLQDGGCAALALIGGDQATQFSLEAFDKIADKERRFALLNCVAQGQVESFLSRMGEVLACDPKMEYWRPVFVFGKMGDKAVPFLLDHLNDTNQNARFNAVLVLGQYMYAEKALDPMRQRFWKEEVPELKKLLVAAITKVADGETSVAFLNEVVAKSKDQKMIDYVKSNLKAFDGYREGFLALKKKRQPSAKDFEKAYGVIYRSAGSEGDFDALAKCSTITDEPALKKLRERILARNSDEALGDYMRVGEIIWQNHYFSKLP